jgi:hypothetical protein
MRSLCIISLRALLGLGLGAFAPFQVAVAQTASSRGVDLLSHATKSYEAGAYADAYAAIEQAFKAGLSNEYAARAILLRAEINEKNGQLARALQDYSNALWMETLPPSERATAKAGKERLIAAMGLSPPSSPSSRSDPVVASAPQGSTQSSSNIFGVFNGLFGSSDQTPAEPARPAAPAPQKETWSTTAAASPPPADKPAPAPKPRSVQATASAAPKKTPSSQTAAAIQPASLTSSQEGGFLIVFGPANSEAAGKEKAHQIKAKLADILVSRELSVEPGASGALQIVAGPYKAKSSATALCNAIKQRGISCQVTP